MTPALSRVVAAIESSDLSAEALGQALSLPLDVADVAEFVRFDRSNYRRNLVVKRSGFELRVLCWLPGQRTSLHGHDAGACAFRVLAGTSSEVRVGLPDRQCTPGTVVEEEGHVVHQVANLGTEPVVSLHAYAPALPVDQPPAKYPGPRIVLIGGGVSSTALAIHLLASGRKDLRIAIVERREWLARGPAYATSDPALRLNVPAERMSLFPDRPLDFIEWCVARGVHVPAGALLPRSLFGRYVEDRLAEAVAKSPSKVWLYRSEVVAASDRGVTLADGTFLEANAVVLATGNQRPVAPSALTPEILESSRVVRDPWEPGALGLIRPDEEVLVVGTGLTAVDVLLSLRTQGHRGKVTALSRRGLLPRPHLESTDPKKRTVSVDQAALPTKARDLSRWLRTEARRLEAQGVGWQGLIDALRPITTTLWQSLDAHEKTVFMRRLRPFWEVVRHRAAPDALERIEEWKRNGALDVVAGRLSSIADDGCLDATIATRAGTEQRRRFDRVVLCTGPDTDVRRWKAPLFSGLLAAGHIAPDAHGIGILTDAAGRAIDGNGTTLDWLFTIGGLRRPHLWETTAVPDIVRQASALVEPLLGALRMASTSDRRTRSSRGGSPRARARSRAAFAG